MSNFLKNIFGKKDDIPEMKLQKNDPKPYYNKQLKCWMIPGQEEEKKKELQEARKGPPPKKITSNSSNTGENTGVNSTGGPRAPTAPGQQRRPAVANRYASALPTENLSVQADQIETMENQAGTNSVNRPTVYNPVREEQIEETAPTDNMNNTLFYSVQENINMTNVNNSQQVTMSQGRREVEIINPSNSVNPVNPESIQNIKEIEENLHNRLELEFNKRLNLIQNEYNAQIIELRDILQFSEEAAEEEKQILRSQLNDFIKQNLELKLENERYSDELGFKQNEIGQYQILIDSYRKAIDETRDLTDRTNLSHSPNSADSSRSDDFVFINTKIEKLEYEKLSLNNELLESKREINSLSLDKCILEYKLKEIENCYNLNSSKLKENYLELEKKLVNSEMQNKILLKNKEALERDATRVEELTKQNEDLVAKLNENNDQLVNIKNANEKAIQEIKNLNQTNSQLKSEILKLKNNLEEKDITNNKALKDLREKMNEYKNELESRDKFTEELKKYEESINQFNLKLFESEKKISNFNGNLQKVKNYLINELTNSDISDISFLVHNVSNLNADNFDVELCFVFSNLLNQIQKMSNDLNITSKRISILNNEINNLTHEVDILKNSKIEKNNAIAKLSSSLNQIQQKLWKLEKESSEKDYLIESLRDEVVQLSNNKANQEEIDKMIGEINQLNNLIKELKSNLKFESSEKERYQTQLSYLQNQISNLNEEICKLNEINFNCNLNNEKITQELKDREDIINYIISDIDTTVNNEEQEFDSSQFIEAALANKVRTLKNLIEKHQYEISILNNENRIYKEELQRKETTNSILDEQIKTLKSTVNLIQNENKNLRKNLKEKENRLKNLNETVNEDINNLNNEILKKDIRISNLNEEIENLKSSYIRSEKDRETITELQKENESLKEKTMKLKELLDNTIAHYEKGLESVKNKQKQKLSEMKERIESLESDNELLKQGTDSKLQEFIEEKEKLEATNNQLINERNDKISLIQSLREDIQNLNNEMNNKNSKIAKTVQLESELKNYKNENEEFTKRINLLESEQEVLINKLSDKDREIGDLRNNLSESESQVEKIKSLNEEINKNYEFLTKNHKSAEKLNELQRKIQHMLEEKNTLTQSHGLIVENLTKEIKSLTEKLNEYKKNDKSLFGEIQEQENAGEENISSTAGVDKNSTTNLNSLVSNKEEEKPQQKQIQEISPRVESPKAKSSNPPQRQFGFFTKLIAPIFLTEKEMESIHGTTPK